MGLLDSFDFRLEKWRYQTVLGVRKIVWFYSALFLLALFPAFGTGSLIATIITPRSVSQPVIPLLTDTPKFKIESATALAYANNKRGYYARVSNKIDDNLKSIGYYPWFYRYTIKDINNVVLSEGSATSYLLPNADTYIVGPILSQPGIQFEIITDKSKSVANKFEISQSKLLELPVVTSANSPTPTADPLNPQLVDIRFSITNTSTYDIRYVDCIFIMRNPDGQIIGIGKYTAENMIKSENREIRLKYPSPNLGTNTTLEVLPQVNYLDEENLKLNVR